MQLSFRVCLRRFTQLLLNQLVLVGAFAAFIALAITLSLLGGWLEAMTEDVFLQRSFAFAGTSVAVVGAAFYLAASATCAVKVFRSYNQCLH